MWLSRLVRVVLAGGLATAGFGCDKEPPIIPTCTLSVIPAGREFPAAGGSQTLTVVASAPTCEWLATPSAAWVVLTSPAAGVGNGAVAYVVSATLAAEPRVASVTIGTTAHAIVQAGASPDVCMYSVSPASVSLVSAAATGHVTITTASQCAWEATSTASWLSVISESSGVGPADIDFRAEANRREYARTATIIVGDQQVAVTQAGEEQPFACDYSVVPVTFSPCMASGTIVTRIVTGDRCSWTVVSDVPWLTLLPGISGIGSTDIRAAFSANYGLPRLGRLLIRWPTATAGQNVQVQQAGCRYGVSRSDIEMAAAGGSASFDVVQQSDPTECGGATQDRCVWSATSDVDWIEVTTSMPRTGDNPVSFAVRANASGKTRTGHITVQDQQVVVVQAGS
jgi:hypothetical protein